MHNASLAVLAAAIFILTTAKSDAAPLVLSQPSFDTFETKLQTYQGFSNKYTGALAGSYNFSGRYFVTSAISFGNSSFAGNERSIGLGIFQPVGESSALFAVASAQRYLVDAITPGVPRTQNSAALSAGIRSIFWNRAELEIGLTALASGPIDTRFGLKGTYHFTEKLGAVLESGSSDGDSVGGIGIQYRF